MRVLTVFLMSAAAVLAADRAIPQVIAHRGGPAMSPENTISAFQNAVRLGVDVLEFDMNVTADDEIVIHHDTAVNPAICSPDPGSAVKAGPIRLLALREILQFDCGSKPPAAHPGQAPAPGARIPTLDQLLSAVRGSKVLLLGETKMAPEGAPDAVPPAKFIDLVYGVLNKHGVQDRFILQSGDYRTIAEIRRRDARVGRCLLGARRFKPDYVALARQYEATHLMLRVDDVDAAGVRRLQAAGVQVFSSTANTKAEWRRYLSMGMDGILTDDPRALMQFLSSAEKARD